MAKFGLLGLGYIAQRHIDAIYQLGHSLELIYDPTKNIEALTADYAPSESDFFELAKQKQCDYIIISSPTPCHKDQILQSLSSGIDAIVEKPTCLSLSELQQIQDLENTTGQHVHTIFQLRYDHVLNQFFQRSFNHRPKIKIHYSGYRPQEYFDSWKGDRTLSGGITAAVGIHYFDLLTHYFGSLKQLVSAQNTERHSTGQLQLQDADIEWDFSFVQNADQAVIRNFSIDNEHITFGSYQKDLHQVALEHILQGNGIGSDDVAAGIEVLEAINRSTS